MTEPAEPQAPTRRAAWWWLAGAVVVVAAVAVTLVLTTGHAGGGQDLGTPEAAAESFAAAARSGSGAKLLSLACVGHLSCVAEHAAGLDAARLADARAVISENASELAHHLGGAVFAPAVDGAAPGTKDVPYRTPAMAEGTTLTLTFVHSGGAWLYLGPAG